MTAGLPIAPIDRAVDALRAGGMVVVIDDASDEATGELVLAADAATPESLAFIVHHSSGIVAVPMLGEDLDRLDIPLQPRDQHAEGAAFTVTVDAATGISTGISAADRAHTCRVLADPASRAGDLTRPGHLLPLRYQAGGVLRRPGHTEAAVDLVRLAGRRPAAAMAEIVSPAGHLASHRELLAFAQEHELPLVSIADLVAHRRHTEELVHRTSETEVSTPYGRWRVFTYRSHADGSEPVALVHGTPEGQPEVLVRMHSECLTGDVFRSLRCDCGPQLDLAMARIADEGQGVIVYLRGHEGRGIGLLHKLQAYELQDRGVDTVDANLQLGLPADARDYGTGAMVLVDLGLSTLRLLTNNPQKRAALDGFGLSIVDRVPVEVLPNEANAHYLRTKAERMGHVYTGRDVAVSTGVGDIAAQRSNAPAAVTRPAPRGVGMAPPPEATPAAALAPAPVAGAGHRKDLA